MSVQPPAHADQAGRGFVLEGDNLELMRSLEDGIATLVYTDPPFNTGARQTRRTLQTVATGDGTGPGSAAAATRASRSAGSPTRTPTTTTSPASSCPG